MKRVAVFAHYDKDNIVSEYVLYYLKNLKAICEKIVFVSDCNLNNQELEKLDNLADYTFAQKHGEYDFGSYKRGFNILKEQGILDNADCLILANDSCYGPFYPFEKIFEEMETKDCHFWGLTSHPNIYGKKTVFCEKSNNQHIQSYFLVLKNNVFNSEVFNNFINSVTKKQNKADIILEYEMGLTNTLCKSGFNYCVYCNTPIYTLNYKYTFNKENLKTFILFKRELLNKIYFNVPLKTIINKLNNTTDYPVQILLNHFNRTRDIRKFNFKYMRKVFIRISIKHREICICGKWFCFGNKQEVR